MLSAAHRLRDAEEFRAATRRGRRASSRTLVAHLRVSEPASQIEPRVGFVVARSVGTAVVRNRVKRRLRGLMRERVADLPPGAALVVRAKPQAAGVGSVDLRTDLDGVLARLRAER